MRRSVVGVVLTSLVGVGLFGSSGAQTRAVFTNPVVEASVFVSARSGGAIASDFATVEGDTTPELVVSLDGSNNSVRAQIQDGVFSAELVSSFSADATGIFTDTLLITSSTLPAGTPVDLQIDLEFSSTLSPNDLDEPCVNEVPTVMLAAAEVISPVSYILWDHTCNSLDIDTDPQIVSTQVGAEFQLRLGTVLNGSGPNGSGSMTARMYVTPLGDFDYVTASGNDYRRVDDEATVEELLENLVELVTSLNLHAGISNALDAKLNSAMNALDDVNQNNDVAAVNSLEALISHIRAQRGKKLTDAQADMLVAAVLEIIGAIEGVGAG